MPTYGQRPSDVVSDSRGNALNGIVLKLYETEALAGAGGTPLETVTTDSSGRWRYSPDAETELWVRLPNGDVWQANAASAASELATHAADTTDVHGIADTSDLILEGDSRLTDARTPTAHTHGVTDLTATGTKDSTTYLRGDNTWAAPPGGGGVTDHGALTGLADDDHTQYALADGTRGSFATTAQGALADTASQPGHAHAGADITSGVVSRSFLPTATDVFAGIVELATSAETLTGTDTARATTPAGVKAVADTKADLVGGEVPAVELPWASLSAKGIVELATSAETTTGTDTARAVTPAGVKAVADTKAATSHTHAASDLASGTVATARLGSGTADSTTFLRGDQTWATPSGGAATIEPRRLWQWGYTNTGGSGYGWSWSSGPTGGSTLGTASGTDTLTLTSAASAGSKAGVRSGSESHVTSTWLPSFEWRGKFSTTSNIRTWVAVGKDPTGDSDDAGYSSASAAARGAGIRYSTVAGDTNYKYVVTSTTGSTVVDSGVAADTSEHVFTVEFLSSTEVRFSIDGAAQQDVTASSGVLDYDRWAGGATAIAQSASAVSVVPRGAGYSFVAGVA